MNGAFEGGLPDDGGKLCSTCPSSEGIVKWKSPLSGIKAVWTAISAFATELSE
jgi:hypothetical protein